MSILRDLTNQRFGKLVALSYSHSNKYGRAQWKCRCDCGVEKVIDGKAITYGLTLSCGCLRRARIKALRYIDGRSAKNEYYVWRNAIERCHDERHQSYPDYGARGIFVCERWRRDFNAFCSDVGPRPSKLHSLDRIDNDKGYEPSNCRWATAKEQAANKRRRLRHRDLLAAGVDFSPCTRAS